jgi:serpin B
VISEETRLVLTNAIYMKAPWAAEFDDMADLPFHINGGKAVKVPGLVKRESFGYQKISGGALVAVPYAGGGLQFLLMIPDERNGLGALEKSLTAEVLAGAAELPRQDIRLHFPTFKLEPERVLLADNLIAMGMPGAFDKPRGSADFSRMAPRKPDDYLLISEVIHKAFIAVDKHGTEAAAATAVVMMRATSMPVEPAEPLEVRVDRPFAFAIQHVSSGACLFLGRVTDPR